MLRTRLDIKYHNKICIYIFIIKNYYFLCQFNVKHLKPLIRIYYKKITQINEIKNKTQIVMT